MSAREAIRHGAASERPHPPGWWPVEWKGEMHQHPHPHPRSPHSRAVEQRTTSLLVVACCCAVLALLVGWGFACGLGWVR